MQKNAFQPDYILLDAARLEDNLDAVLASNDDHVNLYQGSAGLTLSRYAPYLFLHKENSVFANKVWQEGWGNSWGVLIVAAQPIQALRSHFRKFLIVLNHDLKELYFRFYDPRVLRIFLPTCSRDQLKEFFGPVRQFICEDKDPAFLIIYSLEDGNLITRRENATSVFPEIAKYTSTDHQKNTEPTKMDHAHKTPHYLHTQETKKRPPRKYFD